MDTPTPPAPEPLSISEAQLRKRTKVSTSLMTAMELRGRFGLLLMLGFQIMSDFGE